MKIFSNNLNFKTVEPINCKPFLNLHFMGQLNEDKFQKDETFADDPMSYIKARFQDTEKMAKYLPNICIALSKNDENSRNIAALIDYASKNNMTSDFMMDLLKNKKDAIQNSKTGEVFCLADEDFISIKTSDSEISPLKITPESYKKLFPPVKGKVTTQNFHLIVIY